MGVSNNPRSSMAGKLRKKTINPLDQFFTVDDQKLQLSLAALADRYSEKVKLLIYTCYNDQRTLNMYKTMRQSGLYEKGNSDRAKGGKLAYWRKIFEFPNGYVADFVNIVLSDLYGTDWVKNDTAIKHELVRPWWVVNKL